MINTGDLKRGITIQLDNALWTILEYQHIKMGRGSAQVRIKMRNVRTGATIERTFQAGERFQRAILERRTVQYLYESEGLYHFMDNETYEQTALNADQIGDAANYLKDGMNVELLTFDDSPLGIELPLNVELRVTYTEPGFKGDTATGGTKPATLETGAVVQVPLFVKTDDVIRVDTRTNSYLERVS
ncbi:MAG TPA: elongation factor P [Chloroflexota bacterium]|nr:elongation factor P [Chloroflexota bacterium]